jgi:hypothetical protein
MRRQQSQQPPPPKRTQPTATATATAAATATETAADTASAATEDPAPSATASSSAGEAASAGPATGEPPPKDPKKLPATIGYLRVETELEGANVFIYTKDLGKTNTWVEAPCGTQFIRLGKPEPNGPRWMAAGKSVKVTCQDTTTTTGAP